MAAGAPSSLSAGGAARYQVWSYLKAPTKRGATHRGSGKRAAACLLCCQLRGWRGAAQDYPSPVHPPESLGCGGAGQSLPPAARQSPALCHMLEEERFSCGPCQKMEVRNTLLPTAAPGLLPSPPHQPQQRYCSPAGRLCCCDETQASFTAEKL